MAFSACLQMAPLSPNKKTPAKKAYKRMKMDHNLFRFVPHFERYVDLEDLRDTFIPNCFEGRGWGKAAK